jgi:hypothetical protein
VFFGPAQMGAIHEQEWQALLTRASRDNIRLIRVVLQGVEGEPAMPEFMKNFSMVDFRGSKAINNLVYGITGVRPE